MSAEDPLQTVHSPTEMRYPRTEPSPWHHFDACNGKILYTDRDILYMVPLKRPSSVRSVERATRGEELTTKHRLAGLRSCYPWVCTVSGTRHPSI
jgi:hypothetical protein